MPQSLEEQLSALELDLNAAKNGARLSLREIENRSNRILDAVAASPERKQLAPRLKSLIATLEGLIRTLQDKAEGNR